MALHHTRFVGGVFGSSNEFFIQKNEKAATPYQSVEFEEVAFFLYSLGGFDE